jgi:hypothetical protein
MAFQALAPAADEIAFLTFPGVDYPVLLVVAKRAGHTVGFTVGGDIAESVGTMCRRLRQLMPSWKARASPIGTIVTKQTTHHNTATPLAASNGKP